jgi:hypothetical protein
VGGLRQAGCLRRKLVGKPVAAPRRSGPTASAPIHLRGEEGGKQPLYRWNAASGGRWWLAAVLGASPVPPNPVWVGTSVRDALLAGHLCRGPFLRVLVA